MRGRRVDPRIARTTKGHGNPRGRRAITLGIGTLLESRALVLLAAGAERAEAVRRLRGGFVGESLPAAALHGHPDVTVLVDARAASRGGGRRRR